MLKAIIFTVCCLNYYYKPKLMTHFQPTMNVLFQTEVNKKKKNRQRKQQISSLGLLLYYKTGENTNRKRPHVGNQWSCAASGEYKWRHCRIWRHGHRREPFQATDSSTVRDLYSACFILRKVQFWSTENCVLLAKVNLASNK